MCSTPLSSRTSDSSGPVTISSNGSRRRPIPVMRIWPSTGVSTRTTSNDSKSSLKASNPSFWRASRWTGEASDHRLPVGQSWQIVLLVVAVAAVTPVLRHRVRTCATALAARCGKCVVPPVFGGAVPILPWEKPVALWDHGAIQQPRNGKCRHRRT